jgi:hypothetical protein
MLEWFVLIAVVEGMWAQTIKEPDGEEGLPNRGSSGR